jgi:hypothetical protein
MLAGFSKKRNSVYKKLEYEVVWYAIVWVKNKDCR